MVEASAVLFDRRSPRTVAKAPQASHHLQLELATDTATAWSTGSLFHSEHKLRPVLWGWIGETLGAEELEGINRVYEGVNWAETWRSSSRPRKSHRSPSAAAGCVRRQPMAGMWSPFGRHIDDSVQYRHPSKRRCVLVDEDDGPPVFVLALVDLMGGLLTVRQAAVRKVQQGLLAPYRFIHQGGVTDDAQEGWRWGSS